MPKNPALGDAYRNIVVTGSGTPGTSTAHAVDAQFNLDAGFGITLVTDVPNNKVTIVNTGNGTGALTTITDTNASGTFYPIFTRPPPGTQTFTIAGGDYSLAGAPIGASAIYVVGSINDPTGISYAMRAALTGIIAGETLQAIRSSDNATLNYTATGPASYSTIDGNWTIPVNAVNLQTDTLYSITIATGAGEYNAATGTYQMDTMYLDQTTTPLTYNPNTSTLSVSNISGVSFTMSGHVTLEGVTSTGATGTGKIVFDNSPTLITPTLGVASATSINKVTITAPTTGSTITVIDGKVFTVNNTITLQGTDATVITLPATTGTVPLDNQQFYIGTTALTINRSSAAQSLTGITSIDGYASNLAGGNNTTLLGSIHYQSALNVTTQLPPNTTTTRNFLRQTGDGTNGAVPAWDTVTATDVGLGNVTNESKSTMFTSPTFTGHVTLEGVTSTGATGTGNIVFDTSPTLITPVLGTPQSGNFSTGTFTWPTFNQNTTGYAANLSGGNNTTLLGSVHYQSALNVTTQLAPNTTTTKKFLRQTGDGTNGAVPAWDTVTATDVGLGNVTNESKSTMFTSPTFSGTLTISSGTTNATQYTACSSTAGNTMSEVGQKTTSVSTVATTILATPGYMTFALVTGTDGTNRFSDVVLMSVGTGTVNVISSLSAAGTPAARTYSQSSSNFRLAMASGTYTVSVYAFTMTP